MGDAARLRVGQGRDNAGAINHFRRVIELRDENAEIVNSRICVKPMECSRDEGPIGDKSLRPTRGWVREINLS